jgi:hypothetical protein
MFVSSRSQITLKSVQRSGSRNDTGKETDRHDEAKGLFSSVHAVAPFKLEWRDEYRVMKWKVSGRKGRWHD